MPSAGQDQTRPAWRAPVTTIPDPPGPGVPASDTGTSAGVAPGGSSPGTAEPLVTVRLLRAPLPLWERASRHSTELVREFSLLTIGLRQGGGAGHEVPHRLVELAGELGARHAGISDTQVQQLDDALSAGLASREFTYTVPASVAAACQQLQDLLDEADAYCEHGDLMTLVSPPDQRAFRQWYLQEFVRQISGHPPCPWPGRSD